MYDPPSDILYLDACPPYAEQALGDIGDTALIHWNRATGAVERVMILELSQRHVDDPEILALPIDELLRTTVNDLLRVARAA